MDSIRTCLACRKKALKFELCRFVRANDGEICFDETGSLPHRGAWLCANSQCFKKALDKRLLFRGEKVLPIKSEAMIENVYGRIKKNSLSRLGFMRKLGQTESGKEAVVRLIQEDKAYAVLFAKDFANRSVVEVKSKIKPDSSTKVHLCAFLMDEIGQSLGRKRTGVVGLSKSRITDEILLQLNKLSSLEK